MNINYFTVKNFRKLKECKIDLSKESTILVGANNSGKTSAMDALISFLSKDKWKNVNTADVTLSNWKEINEIGDNWVSENKSELKISKWHDLLPSLDVWLNAEMSQIHQVCHLIPSLDWDGGSLGVRAQFEPKNENTLKQLYADFREAEKISRLRKDFSVKWAKLFWLICSFD